MQRRIHHFNEFRLNKHTLYLYICLAFKMYIANIIHVYIFTDVYTFFHVDLLTISSLRTVLVTKKFVHNLARGKREREWNEKIVHISVIDNFTPLRLFNIFFTTTPTFIYVHFNNRLSLIVYRHYWVS